LTIDPTENSKGWGRMKMKVDKGVVITLLIVNSACKDEKVPGSLVVRSLRILVARRLVKVGLLMTGP